MKIVQTTACALITFACSTAFAQPVLRYTFDEASGNALDSGSAPLTDATFEGGATRSPDTPSGSGSSLDMRGEPSYAHLLGPNAPDLNGLAALTITTWLNVETYTSGNHRLLSQQAPTTFGGFSWNMNATPNDGPVGPDNFRLGMFVGNNISAGAADFGAAFSNVDVDAANKWVMLAVTYDSALADGNTKFYIGDLATPMAQLGDDQTLPQLTIDAGTARLGVGFTDAAPTANTSVLGRQDDVRAYATALDLAALEAVRLENVGSGGFDGDFTENGTVDGADLTAWTAGFGTTGTATHMQGDTDADMDVDGADFLVWQQELGLSGPPVTPIPEPRSAVLLLLIGAVCWVAEPRRTT
jgi:hypothetical protein